MTAMLSGLRVADLSIVTAGAAATQVLADFGADVIKIEGVTRPDLYRAGIRGDGGSGVGFPPFRTANRNKRAIAVDLKHPEGLEIVRRLVKTSDVVAENFRRGVVERLGLGFRDLTALRSNIVLASISSQGVTGPDSGFISFGTTLDALGGVMSFTGYDEQSPVWSSGRINYPDQTANSLAPAIILAAVLAARSDGQARWIDLSQRETVTSLIGDQILHTSRTGEDPVPTGNATPGTVEWLSQTSGEDEWVAISLSSPEDIVTVASIVEANLASTADDAARVALVRTQTDAWAAARTKDEAAAVFQRAGIAAAPVNSGHELLNDPYLRDRGWWQSVGTIDGATELQRGWAVQFERGGPAAVRRTAPRVGEDTTEVLRDLGYDEDEISSLTERAVVSLPQQPAVAER
ncbi:CaiB/BaiF CoA transferase family protein [Arthrobacter sp. TMT4-20]